MVLETVMESVFAVVDVFFVSRLGADAVATVGLTESMMTLVYSLAMGLGIGATAIVARRIGERDAEGAAHAAAQAILLGLVLSTVLGIARRRAGADAACASWADRPAVIANAGVHARHARRQRDDPPAVPHQRHLPRRGRRGDRDARALARQRDQHRARAAAHLRRRPVPRARRHGRGGRDDHRARNRGAVRDQPPVPPGRRASTSRGATSRLDPALMWQMIRLSGSGTFQVLIGTASWIGLVRIISSFGSDALAGYTIGIRVIIFALLPSWGLSNAAATMVGQALGAKKPERAERAVWMAARYNLVFLGVVGARVRAVRARDRGALHRRTPRSRRTRWTACASSRCGFLFYAYGMVITQLVQRRGRHVDADLAQPVRVLALGDSARVRARGRPRHGPARCVRRDHGRVLDAGRAQRVAF